MIKVFINPEKFVRFSNLIFKPLFFLSFVTLCIGLIFVFTQKIFFGSPMSVNNERTTEIMVDSTKMLVEIVETMDEKYRGLSFRENLSENEGMLFLHENMGVHEYMMRNMKFDLDFIFIRDEEIVDVAKNVSKDFKGIVRGATTYNKVLEIPAGLVAKKNIKLGGEIKQ